jgi:hypothetical protein
MVHLFFGVIIAFSFLTIIKDKDIFLVARLESKLFLSFL